MLGRLLVLVTLAVAGEVRRTAASSLRGLHSLVLRRQRQQQPQIYYSDPRAARAAVLAWHREHDPPTMPPDMTLPTTLSPSIFAYDTGSEVVGEANLAAPIVSIPVCNQLSGLIGENSLGCSLVDYISGVPEGCECKVKAAKCPFKGPGAGGIAGPPKTDLGFTGMSPTNPFSTPEMGGQSVVLCMFWQWRPAPPDNGNAKAAKADSKRVIMDLVRQADENAAAMAKGMSDTLWVNTPTPIPHIVNATTGEWVPDESWPSWMTTTMPATMNMTF